MSAVLVLCCAFAAKAENTPCSGRKSGIAACQGETFICNDGSVSGSKRSCSAYMGGFGPHRKPRSSDDTCLELRMFLSVRHLLHWPAWWALLHDGRRNEELSEQLKAGHAVVGPRLDDRKPWT